MVKINNKEFKIYDLDNLNSIKSRISADLNTLPEYLINFDFNIEDMNSKSNIMVLDLLDILKKTKSFSEFYTNYKESIGSINISKIIEMFIFYNENLGKKQLENYLVLLIKNDISQVLKENTTDIDRILVNKKESVELIKKQISNNIKNSKKNTKILEEFENVKLDNTYTNFELEIHKFELILDMKNISILDIFNSIKLSEDIPFAYCNNFYKILKKNETCEDWSYDFQDILVLKFNLGKKNNIIIYEDILINIDNKKVFVYIVYDNKKINISESKFIEKIISCFNLEDIKIEKIIDKKLSGPYYITNQNFNNYIMSDLILNDKLFSTFLSTNESKNATRKKFFLYLDTLKTGLISASITHKEIKKIDFKKQLKNKDKNVFEIGSFIIRIQVRSNNLNNIKEFQRIFSKFMSLYNKKYKEIEEYYQMFFKNFNKFAPKKQISDEIEKLSDILPELFLKKYSRSCTASPTIISDEEYENKYKKYKKMIFPKEGDNTIERRNYICVPKKNKNQKQIYPGLQKNKLSNKDKFPYVPCCYVKDQSITKGSNFRKYFFNEEKVKKKIIQQDLLVTNKFAPLNGFAKLPENTFKLFNILDYNKEYEYIRLGVYKNPNSLINCILNVFGDDDIKNLNNDKDALFAYIYTLREKMATDEYSNLCKQELFDYSIEEIKSEIKNNDVYFDPKKFIRILEYMFNCNIYIFSRLDNEDKLVIPRHIQTYYNSYNNDKCIFIYEHMGSESDKATYPQCEIICKWDKNSKDGIKYSFENKEEISIGIKDIFNKLNESYSLKSKNIISKFSFKSEIVGQTLDSYGKCRSITMLFNNNYISIVTNKPIQPLYVKQNNIINKTPIENCLKFCAYNNITVLSQTIENNKSVQINGKIGNIYISIYINDSDILKSVPINTNINKYNNFQVKSKLQKFIRNRKLSIYILEYIFWFFSKYISENNIEDINKSVFDFYKKYILLDKNFEYNVDKVYKKFDINDNGIIKNNKVVFNSEELIKRVIYVLKLEFLHNKENILNYKNLIYMKNYYSEPTDFNNNNDEVILQGIDSSEKWLVEKNKKINILENKINLDNNNSYFFKNDILGNDIKILKNTDNLNKAINISNTWNNKKYIEKGKDEEIKLDYNLYSYVNNKDITIYNKNSKINIFGYKNNENLLFTSILDL